MSRVSSAWHVVAVRGDRMAASRLALRVLEMLGGDKAWGDRCAPDRCQMLKEVRVGPPRAQDPSSSSAVGFDSCAQPRRGETRKTLRTWTASAEIKGARRASLSATCHGDTATQQYGDTATRRIGGIVPPALKHQPCTVSAATHG